MVSHWTSVCLYVRPSVVRQSVRPSVRFSFPDGNFSKYKWIFTKFGMRIDIVEIWFGITNEKFRQMLTKLCPRHAHIFVSGR